VKQIIFIFGILVLLVTTTYSPNAEAACDSNTIDPTAQIDGGVKLCGSTVEAKVKIKEADPKNVDPAGGDFQTSVDGATIRSGTEIGAFSQIRPGCDIGDDVRIGQSVVLGKDCKVSTKTQIGNGTIMGGNPRSYDPNISYRFGNDLIISPNTDMSIFPANIYDHIFYETTVSFGMLSLFHGEVNIPTPSLVSGAETGNGSTWEVTPNVWLLSAFPSGCDPECDSATLTYTIGSSAPQGTVFTIAIHETNGLGLGFRLGCELEMGGNGDIVSTGDVLPLGRNEYVLGFPSENTDGATLTCKLETSAGAGGGEGPSL